MKKTVDDKLNDILDVQATVVPTVNHAIAVTQPAEPEVRQNVEDDYEYARGNLKGLIENGKTAMENIIFLAKEGESPRAYEVVGQLIKTLAETNKDLLALAKAKKDIQKEKEDTQSPTHVTNALFVGSTAELQKLISKK